MVALDAATERKPPAVPKTIELSGSTMPTWLPAVGAVQVTRTAATSTAQLAGTTLELNGVGTVDGGAVVAASDAADRSHAAAVSSAAARSVSRASR